MTGDKVGVLRLRGTLQSLASLPTASEKDSSPALPAHPLPSTQTFAFQTQIRRCQGLSASPAPTCSPGPEHLLPHRVSSLLL